MWLLVDDADMQPTMARLPMGPHAHAVRWSPDGGVLAVAAGGPPLRNSSAAGQDVNATRARLAKRGSGQRHMRSNEAEILSRDLPEDKAAVLLISASGAGLNHAGQCCPRVTCLHTPGLEICRRFPIPRHIIS